MEGRKTAEDKDPKKNPQGDDTQELNETDLDKVTGSSQRWPPLVEE
jgi:hypothetical protein